ARRCESLSLSNKSPCFTGAPSTKLILTTLPLVSGWSSTPSSASTVPVAVIVSVNSLGVTKKVDTFNGAAGLPPDSVDFLEGSSFFAVSDLLPRSFFSVASVLLEFLGSPANCDLEDSPAQRGLSLG